jgi:orotate phosphoribosyltransferase
MKNVEGTDLFYRTVKKHKLFQFLSIAEFIKKTLFNTKISGEFIGKENCPFVKKNFIHLRMMNREKKIANLLLQNKAIILNPAKPFTWSSGWKSPIYCDNRKTLSYPDIRNEIKNDFFALISEKFSDVQAIAGVATGAIAQGALIADVMNLPFLYVRSSAKAHGMENFVEGDVVPESKVVVVEDLISTGSSSLNAIGALRKAGANVIGMVAIFTYGFKLAEENFRAAGCPFYTLSNYDCLIELALETGYIQNEQLDILRDWRKSPGTWNG